MNIGLAKRTLPASPAKRPGYAFWEAEQRPLFLFLLVASGAAYPLTFLPVAYEALILGSLALLGVYQLTKGKVRIPGLTLIMIAILGVVFAFQVAKVLSFDGSINVIQFLRGGIYGFAALIFTTTLFSHGFGSPVAMLNTANAVMRILAPLIFISAIIGIRIFGTGFSPELNVSGEFEASNFRFISYYTQMISFLLFYNAAVALKTDDRSAWLNVAIALPLILLTGTRTLIVPTLALIAAQFALSGRMGKAASAALVAAAMFFAVALLVPEISDAFLSRFEVTNFVDPWRQTERLLAWKAYQNHPILGLPLGTPYTHFMSYLAGDEGRFAQNANYDLHNEYLWFLLYFGAVGALLIVALVAIIVVYVARVARATAHGQAFLLYMMLVIVPMFYAAALLRGIAGLWLGVMVGICISAARARRPAASVPVPIVFRRRAPRRYAPLPQRD